jgi:hypothetical protein
MRQRRAFNRREQHKRQIMYVGIDPARAPLARYNSQHLKEIKLKELTNALAAKGVELVRAGASSVELSLRNLIPANGTLHAAQVALMEVLQMLGADSVSLTAADLIYIGGNDVFTHSIARGLEANVEGLRDILTDIPVDEDDGVTLPIFNRIDRAAHFVVNDRHSSEEVNARLRAGAERDLQHNGLLDANNTYAEFLEPRQDADPAPLPRDFQTQPKPYRSIFDREE